WWAPIGKYTGKVNYPGVLVSKEDYEASSDSVKAVIDENKFTTEPEPEHSAEAQDTVDLRYGKPEEKN
ncbi:MAG: hypothetical protein IJR73_03830, partial [Bacteroidales bacterium]|nr:hypothetical protein [Bacteroidales bacterium]